MMDKSTVVVNTPPSPLYLIWSGMNSTSDSINSTNANTNQLNSSFHSLSMHSGKLIVLLLAIVIAVALVLFLRGCCERVWTSDHFHTTNPALAGTFQQRTVVVYVSIVTSMLLTSVVGLAVCHACDPALSALSGDTSVVALQTLWGISPITSAIVTSFIVHRPLSELRLSSRFGYRILAVVYIFPLLVGTMVFGLVILIRVVSGIDHSFVLRLRDAYELPKMNQHGVLAIGFLFSSTVGIWWDPTVAPAYNWGNGSGFTGGSWLLEAIFEEIGWTGILFPELFKLFGFRFIPASLFTGVLWAAWHWLFIIGTAVNYLPEGTEYVAGIPTTPVVYALFMFTLTLVALRIVLCWSYVTSSSTWPSIFGHAAHNVMTVSFTAQLVQINSKSKYFMSEVNPFLCCLYTILALACIYRTFGNINFSPSHRNRRSSETPLL